MEETKRPASDVTTETVHNLTRDFMKTPDPIPVTPAPAAAVLKSAAKDLKKIYREASSKAVGISFGVGVVAGLLFSTIFKSQRRNP